MTNTADTTTAAPPSRDRDHAVRALLDAAERLLVSEGRGRISTRRVAQEAGVNHGLVHYYFGSMEELFVQVLERFTERLIARQRAMYAADVPFIEKWRTAWRFHEDDLAAGYPKIWWELQAMAWNDARLRERLVRVNDEWRAVLREAFARALDEYGVAAELPPLDGLVSLVMLFAQGAQTERLLGIDTGHAELLAWIDGWLAGQQERSAR
jgi:TetR/AcrR family transcriptional regulator